MDFKKDTDVNLQTHSPTDPLGQGTAAGRLNFVLGHQIADVMVFRTAIIDY